MDTSTGGQKRAFLFERNLLALSQGGGELCARLSTAETTLGRYRFLEARSGEVVPARVDAGGSARPLHSLVSPEKEAQKLAAAASGEGFCVFLGLGGGYHIRAALARDAVSYALVIDYDIDGTAELLCSQDYSDIFSDRRFSLLVDASPSQITSAILSLYQPVLHGGIHTTPLRSRVECDRPLFEAAIRAIQAAVDNVSSDISVQARFGKRWFSNIIRNLGLAEKQTLVIPPKRHVSVCAAGPSLDAQLPQLAKKREGTYLIATDTSLPSLLEAGLTPDAVVSIDCQHISCLHFTRPLSPETTLFLDLASPPLLARQAQSVFFFSGGHPLTRYIAQEWRQFPAVDTSGGNVTFTAVALADRLGARSIELYGADFAYPQGRAYTRAAYIYPYFARRQNRLCPTEAQLSAFLYGGPPLKRVKTGSGGSWYYETPNLRAYRERLEELARTLSARLLPIAGQGAPIALPRPDGAGPAQPAGGSVFASLLSAGPANSSAAAFLSAYRKSIETLPPLAGSIAQYLGALTAEQAAILATLLPTAAAIRRTAPDLAGAPLLAAVRQFALTELARLPLIP